ncbi:M61 family metallopeptidase [Maribacter algarum]|uniref:M61 family metallopeptidase n=1 Tax=Maribacter algarum (ex Zhang et al. 2020) TaxID=2578118 RepID=A0A5S3PWQ0_9FLAO|nr:PDZ domain-containing protein [Maribacter algarum]TMM59280.1 M61 family metallopeptidase [Maribacter algarum]
MKTSFLILFFYLSLIGFSQTNSYEIFFENAVHHEAEIKVTFPEIIEDTLLVRMSRTSPGRYALHEFAKNIYAIRATDGTGKKLKITRPNPYEWSITGHNGTIHLNYTLFANRGDGTYSQIDETHAHLNIPATFMYAPTLSNRPVEVNFKPREDLNWKVATQLHLVSGTTYSAPNLSYFMDSPTELSNFQLREFQVGSKDNNQTIQLVLHHKGTEQETDEYFDKVKKVVLAEKEVYGELPVFDYEKYTFLACYIPNASGDGMEHRNSTILTSTRSLADGGMERNIGTVSHEFFHAWNVERIRPKSLKPFDFEEANMSGELWFAEGFTSYYTNLILCRAGLITPEKYVEGLTGTFNYVWNSPARQFFNPIEMSYQAPFVDASTSVDPVNRENTFISYYSYGSVLGLALDLSLRVKGLNLDDYMKLVWEIYGKNEVPYTIEDLHKTLNAFAGKSFGDSFFNSFIYKSGMPDYETLLGSVGVALRQYKENPYFGASVKVHDSKGNIQRNVKIGSPAYKAGLAKGDVITAINNKEFEEGQKFDDVIKQYAVGDTLSFNYIRFDVEKTTVVTLEPNPSYKILLSEKEGIIPSKEVLSKRKSWLKVD